MSLSTLYNDPGKLENFVLQYLQPWAFTVYGRIVIVNSACNVSFVKEKLAKAGYPDIVVKYRGNYQ